MNDANTNHTMAPQARDAILKARALALAEQPVTEAAGTTLEVLEFRLAAETYGIESSYVSEVYPLKEFTPLPGTPDFVLGIMSVRGQIYSIFDLRKFFHLPGQSAAPPSQVIIVRSGAMEAAIPVDQLVGVGSLRPRDLQSVLPTLVGETATYLLGVTGERLALLDIAKLLEDPGIIVGEGEV